MFFVYFIKKKMLKLVNLMKGYVILWVFDKYKELI